MSGELRAVSRAAQREREKGTSRQTKAISLAKAVGIGAAAAAAAAAALAIGRHMLYTTPEPADADVDDDEHAATRLALRIENGLRLSTASRAIAQNKAERTPDAEQKRKDAQGKFILAGLYYEGRGVTLDKSKALGLYEQAAASGNKMAQFALGNLYDLGHVYGRRLRQNKDTAAAWYRLAADPRQIVQDVSGYTDDERATHVATAQSAVAALATLYLPSDSSASPTSTRGMTQETRDGARKARKAAEAAKEARYATIKHGISALKYGAILEDEYDTRSVETTGRPARLSSAAEHPAYEWYAAAARAPAFLPDAQLRLADIVETEGSAGAVQIAQGLREDAAKQGNDRAMFMVASRLDGGTPGISDSDDSKHPTQRQKDEAISMFRMAAGNGNVEAMLALIHLDQPKRDDSAERWCQLAIAEGSAEASFEYGEIMMGRQNYDQARRLFVTAADFGVTKAHNRADDAATLLRPARTVKIDIQVFPTSSICDQELAVIVEPARLAHLANFPPSTGGITEEAGAAYERRRGRSGAEMHVIHVASPPLPPDGQDLRDRTAASSRLTKAYTNVLRVFVKLVSSDKPPKPYKLRLRPIVLEGDRALWAEPRTTAHAILMAVSKVQGIAGFISRGAVTMHVFEGYSAVLDYKAAFGLLGNSDAPSYGRPNRSRHATPKKKFKIQKNSKIQKFKNSETQSARSRLRSRQKVVTSEMCELASSDSAAHGPTRQCAPSQRQTSTGIAAHSRSANGKNALPISK